MWPPDQAPGAAPASPCPAATWSPSPSSAASGPGRSWGGVRRVRLQWYICLKEHKATDWLSSSYVLCNVTVMSNELYYLNVFTLIPSWPELLWGLLETPPPEMMSRYCHFCVDIIFFIVWISTSISSRMMPRTDRATMAMSSWFHLINSKFYICLRHIYLDSKEMNKKNERCFIPKGEWNEIKLKGHQFDSHHK